MNSKKNSLKSLVQTNDIESDVKKMGSLIKLKTNKKKYFVLRESSGSNSARLEYYDTEKKFKNGSQPKRSIILKNCFSINSKIDARNKYAFALYTKDDCFAVVVDDETQLKDWLDTLMFLQSRDNSLDSSAKSITVYDYVWQVSIMMKGLGSDRNMSGVHRLCLTAHTLYIVKVDPQVDSPGVYELPLITIRRCGHTSSAFFMELGRSSSIGPGDLWIQAEDSTIAHNMHNVILNAMKCSKNPEEFPSPRPRSASTSDKPITSRRPQISHINQSTINPIATSTVSSLQTPSSSTTSNIVSLSSIRDRCDSMPSRSRTTSETENVHDTRTWLNYHHHTSHHSVLTYGRTMSYSPPNNNPLSPSSGACSTDSVVSSLSMEDNENNFLQEHHLSMHNTLRSEPPITEEEAIADDYLTMEPKNTTKTIKRCELNLKFGSVNKPNSFHTEETSNNDNYLIMNRNVAENKKISSNEEKSEYMPMSPLACNETENVSLSRRSSGFDKSLNAQTCEYMPMTAGQQNNLSSDEYLNMTPISSSLPRHINDTSNKNPIIQEEFHLEKVKSYFSANDDSLDYITPVRAYSIGSRPQLKPIRINAKSKNEEEIRTRAFSMGSQANAKERVAAKKKALLDAQIGAPNKPIDEVVKASKKASSAPLISSVEPRKRSATVGSRPVFNKTTTHDKSDSDLMEIDYSVKSNVDKIKRISVAGGLPSSITSNFRPRSNSRSSNILPIGAINGISSPSTTSSLSELSDKRKIHSNSNIYVDVDEGKSLKDREIALNRSIDKKMSNDYLQVVIETKLPSTPTSTPLQSATPQSSNGSQYQNHNITLSSTQFKANNQNNKWDDSGDYVCLDINSNTNTNVPQLPQYKYIVNKSLPENIPLVLSQTILPLSVPQYENVEIKTQNINDINISENLTKTRPISCHLPEFRKQYSVPNAINATSPINFRKISCPSNLNQTSLSPLISSKRITNNKNNEELKSSTSKASNLYENVSLCTINCRPSSVSSERELNYASLDLAPSSSSAIGSNASIACEERVERVSKSQLSLSGNGNIASSSSSSSTTPVASLISCGSQEININPSDEFNTLSYAEIDFKKSEGLKNTASSARN